MLDILFFKVFPHRDALLPEDLVILRAGQRRQAEEFENVERKLLLNDCNIAPDRLRRVCRKTEDIASKRDDALRLPGEQHLAVLGDLVLALFCSREIVRIDVLQSDEDAR